MSLLTVLTWVGPILEVGILVGLFVRRRVCEAVVLPVLLVALVVSATTVAVCPAWNTWDFWVTKELVHTSLLLALGLELAHRGFSPHAARLAARRWSGLVLLAVLVVLATSAHGRWVVDTLPRLVASVAWLYTGLSIIMLRHNRRIDGLHDTILTGFAAYLMTYAALWSQAGETTRLAALVNPPVQIVVLVALLIAVWRPRRAAMYAARSGEDAAQARASVPRPGTLDCLSSAPALEAAS